MDVTRISKIAGLGIVGFMIVSGVADKINLNPLASQVAGFTGAFLGTLVAKVRDNRRYKETADAAARGEDGQSRAQASAQK